MSITRTPVVLALAVAALLAVPAAAQDVFQPSTIAEVTEKARDEQNVFVRGTVTGFPDASEVTLKDASGSILVDVDTSHVRAGLPIGATILVVGQVERDDKVQIDADWVRVVQPPSDSNPSLKCRTIADVFNKFKNGEIVVIRGRVITFKDKEELVLKDDTGSITVDLDQDLKQRDGIRMGDELLILCKADKEGLFEPVKELDALVILRNPKGKAAPAKPAVTKAPPVSKPVTVGGKPAKKKSLEERLATLKSLFEKDLITKEDYETRKKAILDEI